MSRGQSVQIDNIPELGGMPNPTEDGERLWLAAVGGDASPREIFPFLLGPETACRVPDEDERNYFIEVQRLIVSGDGFSVAAEPQQGAAFTVDSGKHAGRYLLNNVKVLLTGPLDVVGETRLVQHFSIVRAD